MSVTQPDKRSAKAPRPEGLDEHGRPVRVLVVDDEVLVRKLTTQILKSAGYEVAGEATDGKTAVAMYKRLKPDLVVLDLKMPIMDGHAALKEMLATDPKARIIMLTSESERDEVTRILRSGVRDYIVKPLERLVFLEKLRKARGAD